jgi:hypothetical protein
MAIHFLKDDDGDKQIPYDEAVVNGRNIVLTMKENQFELGRIADKLEPKYGDHTLERFAEDIGIDHGTLKSYRTTYKAWKDMPARPPGYSVAKVLNRHPNRADIIQETPDITVKEAEKKMLEWKKEHSAEKGRTFQTDYAVHKNAKQIISALNEFLSDKSVLTSMILEIHDQPAIDPRYIQDIIEALGKVSLRIQTLIETAFHKSEPDTVKEEVEVEAN